MKPSAEYSYKDCGGFQSTGEGGGGGGGLDEGGGSHKLPAAGNS